LIELRNGDAVAVLLPEIGGSIARFAVGGVDILRPAPTGTADVLETASFPLVPFANRIADAAFAFGGETIRLQKNFGDHPHALHGQGWQSAWQVDEARADAATLSFHHAAGDWPWEYRAIQTITVRPDALHMSLRLENPSGRPMPASLGFHPYFPKEQGAVLQADVAGVWLSDETQIPTVTAAANHFIDLAAGADLSNAPFVDHCHFGWSRRAMIRRPSQTPVVITASPELIFLHIYAPPGADFFCAEPVSAMPDAVHHEPDVGGLRIIEPGGALTVWAEIARRC
jgi:aldose 1-epimerase